MKVPSDASATRVYPTSDTKTPVFRAEPGVEIKRARPADVHYIATNMRAADRLDLRGVNPVVALNNGLWDSEEAMTLWVAGKPVAMFGVVPVKRSSGRKKYIPRDARWGSIWLLGTDDINKIPTTFLRQCKPVLHYLTATYDLVFNWVHIENYVHRRWIDWMGFQYLDTKGAFLPNV